MDRLDRTETMTDNESRAALPSAARGRGLRLGLGGLALTLALVGCSGPAEETGVGADQEADATEQPADEQSAEGGAAGESEAGADAEESGSSNDDSDSSDDQDDDSDDSDDQDGDDSDDGGSGELTGRGDYEFSHGGQDIDVHYSNEAADPATARIVVVMHGTGRTADSYRDAFADESQGEDVIILAPEFDDDAYEEAEDYQGGNLEETDGDVNEEEDRSFEVIEPMVQDFVEQTGGEQDSFSIFGHSAGGQFVHRYLAYAPDAPVDAAVAANAGWYMMPDDQTAFPYGTGQAPVPVDIEQWVAQDMLVLLGEDDVEQDENLRDTPEAMEQGQTRLERGKTFHEAGQEAAGGGEFGWELQTVPDAGHDKVEMAPEAMDYILGHPQS